MAFATARGVRAMRFVRSQSPREPAAFWIVLIVSYLALVFLAGVRGIGYSERADTASQSITIELNSFLWLPDVWLRADPAANPVPFLLWWVVIATFTAGVVMGLFRLLFPRDTRPPGIAEKRAPARSPPPGSQPRPAAEGVFGQRG